MLEIHVIPHSHDDVGWLKTVDEYFYGYKNDIQLAGVQYTIEGVVTELLLDPRKTFVYVEMAFFYRWYKNQNQEKKDQVKGLVNSGQLEFITGGVCMNDEANPYYEDMIDQMTWGHQLISREFKVAPSIGWQIDPFGHSST
jgi:alpha-mannosidase